MQRWEHVLGALEERTRCLGLALEAGRTSATVADVDMDSCGQLPPHLALRARVLLAETERLHALLARRTGPQARAAARYAGH